MEKFRMPNPDGSPDVSLSEEEIERAAEYIKRNPPLPKEYGELHPKQEPGTPENETKIDNLSSQYYQLDKIADEAIDQIYDTNKDTPADVRIPAASDKAWTVAKAARNYENEKGLRGYYDFKKNELTPEQNTYILTKLQQRKLGDQIDQIPGRGKTLETSFYRLDRQIDSLLNKRDVIYEALTPNEHKQCEKFQDMGKKGGKDDSASLEFVRNANSHLLTPKAKSYLDVIIRLQKNEEKVDMLRKDKGDNN